MTSFSTRKVLAVAACLVLFGGGALLMGSGLTGGATPVAYKVITKHATVPVFQIERINVVCPAGMVPVGGGAHPGVNSWPRSDTEYGYVAESSIDLAGNGWGSTVVATDHGKSSSFTVSAVCARFT
jgi:hypothetical protein